jgi:putative addiction module component (TIGR02574 family)
MTEEQLEKEAETLSEEECIELAERIMVNFQMDPEIEAAWIAEAERRWHDLKDGKTKPIPAADAIKAIRERLNAKRSTRPPSQD